MVKLFVLAFLNSIVNASGEAEVFAGSTFNEVWQATKSDPYKGGYPRHRVSLKSLASGGVNHMLDAAKETLSSDADLWNYKRVKLIRPNGICLAGTWNISEKTSYTGLFATGAKGLMIGRASVMSNEVERGQKRAFGLAGKVFPTLDPEMRVKTANFFTIDNNAGTDTPHFTRTDLLNRPKTDILSLGWMAIKNIFAHFSIEKIRGLIKVQKAQKQAEPGGNVKIRQLYPLSEASGVPESKANSPVFMKLRGSPDFTPAVQSDFRDELRVSNYPNRKLKFDIFVSDDSLEKDNPTWRKIGFIEFTSDVTSESCDQRLTFAHPKYDSGKN